MRPNRDGKAVVPGKGGYEIQVVEVTGGPDWMMPMPSAKSRGRLIPMGTGEDLPDRPSPVCVRAISARRQKRSKTRLVPTTEELEQLPRWARVAFAARGARRVLPAFGFFWKQAPEEHLRAVAKAVSVAEHRAATARCEIDLEELALSLISAELAFRTAADARDRLGPAKGAAAVARAALNAFDAAHSDDGKGRENWTCVAQFLFNTATLDTPLTAQLRCIRRDFARLKRLAREQKWTDDTPVPPDVFGPMWPEGVAPDWAIEPPAPPVSG